MRIGGAEKSLANLLNLIDLNEYDNCKQHSG